MGMSRHRSVRRHLAAIPLFALTPLTLAVCVAVGTSPEARAQPGSSTGAARTITVAAQPLSRSLTDLARQTGATLVAAPALLAGKAAPAVSGTLTPQQALNQLLEGSGLLGSFEGGVLTVRLAATGSEAGLPQVSVTASAELPGDLPKSYVGGQVARGSRAGLLGNKDVLDTPFNVTSFTAELMENQQAITVADVLANDPAVRSVSYGLTNAAGAGDLFLIRGFPVQNSVLFDGVGGIAPSRTLPAEIAERIEVLKGPNALLNGMAPGAGGAVGGAINMVPKRADDKPVSRLTTSYMSDGVIGAHLDVGRRFGDEHQWGVRFNGIYRDGKTATEGQSIEQAVAAIGIDYRGNQLRASLDVGHQTLNNDAPQGAGGFGIADDIALPSAPAASNRVAQDWEFSRTRSNYLLLKAEYDISPTWTLHAAAGASKNKFRYLSTDIYVTDTQGNAQATTYFWPDWNDYQVAQGGLRGSLEAGNYKHQIAVDVTSLKKEHGYTAEYYGFSSFNTNIYAPPVVDRPSLAGFSADPPKTDTLELPSVAISDTISTLDGRLAVTLGARRQRVKYISYDSETGLGTTTYNESATTPVLAALFKLQDSLSLYANYIEGLSQGDSAPMGTTNAGQVFAPIKTTQREVGLKQDLGRFMATASLFQIEKPSGLAVSNGDGSFTYRMSGEQRNRGLELSIFGEAMRGLRLLGGTTYTDARLTQTFDGIYDGKRAPNVSRWQLNLGGEYDIVAAPGLTLSARMISTGSQYLNEANSRSMPGWTRWDIGARYRTAIDGQPVVLRAGIQNLFDRDYWASGSGSWLYLGQARTATLSASFDF